MNKAASPLIGIIRYSAGNTGSVQRALTRFGISFKIIEKPADFKKVDGVIFPGAGAAGAAMKDLKNKKLVQVIAQYKKPFLGLCLGMQLLFEYSQEDKTKCLGIIKGQVKELPNTLVKPHLGWNKLNTGSYAYFVHTYYCCPSDPSLITMTVNYGEKLCAGIRKDNFYGLQWHPEKSATIGDEYLLTFAELCK